MGTAASPSIAKRAWCGSTIIGLPLPAQRKHLKWPDISGFPTQQLASARYAVNGAARSAVEITTLSDHRDHLPANVRTAYIFNPQQKYSEFLGSILYDLTGRMPHKSASSAFLHDALFNVLAKLAGRGTRVALLIDEAHCLSPELLEGLRLLSNLETGKRKLISLMLIGQNELEHTLQAPAMRALRQRISVWHRLRPFTRRESAHYIRYRLQVARIAEGFEFSAPACLLAHNHARGVPRRLNQICDRALLAAYASGRRRVSAGLMQRAAREVTALEEL